MGDRLVGPLVFLGGGSLGLTRRAIVTACLLRCIRGHLLCLALALLAHSLGVLSRRNILIILLSVELMLNAAVLAFVGFASRHGNLDGHIMVFFIITVAAAEVAVGLAIVIALFRVRETVNADNVSLLKR